MPQEPDCTLDYSPVSSGRVTKTLIFCPGVNDGKFTQDSNKNQTVVLSLPYCIQYNQKNCLCALSFSNNHHNIHSIIFKLMLIFYLQLIKLDLF